MSEEKGLLDLINEHLARGETDLPACTLTGLRVQEGITKEGASFGDIEKLISYDQALASKVLKVANSAFYRGLHTVSSIKDAIMRLGTIEVSNIVTLLTQRQLFEGKDPFVCELLEKLWQHSVACAVGAQWIARACSFRTLMQESFLAGLLHDIGKLFLLIVVEDMKLSKKLGFQLNKVMINQSMADLHTECGFELLKSWNVPEIYYRVAREHHKEGFDHNDDLLVTVRMANLACRKMGIALEADSSLILASTAEAGVLGLSTIAIAELQVKMEDSLALVNYEKIDD